jgi:5-methylcytosine-specific restriction enzyme subunit McrC
MRLTGVGGNQSVPENVFSRIDLNYLIQESLDNNESEREMENEAKIFQNALDFSKVKLNRQMKDYEQVLLWCKTFLLENSFSPYKVNKNKK